MAEPGNAHDLRTGQDIVCPQGLGGSNPSPGVKVMFMEEEIKFREISEAVWEMDRTGDMRVPVRIIAVKPLLEQMRRDRTFWQIRNVASMPGIVKHALVMPDGHEGYGFPIGGVAAFDADEGIISPGGVGYDINCGVRLVTTPLTYDDVKPKIGLLIRELFKNVPSGVGSKGRLRLSRQELEEALVGGVEWAIEQGYGRPEDAEHCEENGRMEGADPSAVSDRAIKRGLPQFGTLGAGNHFLEVQKVSDIFIPEIAERFGLSEDQVVVMIHCGSRGFGHQVCDDYIRVMLRASEKYGIRLPDKELCAAPIKSREAENYIKAMKCAVNYAFTNRHIIMHWVRETFDHVFGRGTSDEMNLVYDVAHNIAKFEEHDVDGKRMRLVVHRKGATRAFAAGRPELPMAYRDIGQPVLIPGSMGTASYVLVGKEEGMRTSFGSTCHGAGRVMSRHAAVRSYPWSTVKESLSKKGITLIAADRRVISEEAPQAYKDIDLIVKSVAKAGISDIVAKMVPIGVVKG